MAKVKEKEVAVRNSETALTTGEDFSVTGSMDQIDPRLPQIGIIHQGQLFEMPDGEKLPEFTGVILDLNRANAYWKESFSDSGGGTPPDCSSIDGIHADLNTEECPSPTGKCGHGTQPECPMNRFGSAGRGKACKNLKRMHVILAGHKMPLRLTLPPTSIKALDIYVSLLASKGYPYQRAETKFGLKQSQNKEGIKYSEITLHELRIIEDPSDELNTLKQMYRDWKPVMRGQPVQADEYY